MLVMIGAIHVIYACIIIAIIIAMVLKKDTVLICILGILIIGLVATGSITQSIEGVFNSLVFAIRKLSGIIMVISIMVGFGEILKSTGINDSMVSPIAKLIRTPTIAYWSIGVVIFIASLFFWPYPATVLLGTVLLPVALKVNMPRMAVAQTLCLFGCGFALSGDFVIQGAPTLVAEGAGLDLQELINASIPLVFVMGVTTTLATFILIRKDKRHEVEDFDEEDITEINQVSTVYLPDRWKKIFAIIVPLSFLTILFVMIRMNITGDTATALIGGTSLLLLIILCIITYRKRCLDEVKDHLVLGFQFGFKVFGPVIPVAAFFYMGDSGITTILGDVIPESTGIVNDIGIALSNVIPNSKILSTITVAGVGAITGLDGSGFSGIQLVASIAKIFGLAIGHGVLTLAALGQIAAIWVGGGTIVPWAVLPVAAICRVDPIELAARNIKPVAIGMVVTIIVSILIL